MGRTKKTNIGEEARNQPFPKRLRELLDRPGETQGKLAEAIGVNRQSIGQWKDGITTPDVNALNKIADYFKVSTDYLLGRTDVTTTEIDIRAIHEKTGLSERAISKVLSMKRIRNDEEYSSSIFALNKLLEYHDIEAILNKITSLRKNYVNKLAFIEAGTEFLHEKFKDISDYQFERLLTEDSFGYVEDEEGSRLISIKLTPVEYYGYKMTELKETLAASIQDMIYLDTKDVDLEPIKKKMSEGLKL